MKSTDTDIMNSICGTIRQNSRINVIFGIISKDPKMGVLCLYINSNLERNRQNKN